MTTEDPRVEAARAALLGDWDHAHGIVQERSDPISRWIHAVLHKMEGDAWNSRYWYARTEVKYEDHSDPAEELRVILDRLA